MAQEIGDALNRLNERKSAISGDGPRVIDGYDLVAALSGFDLDPDEVLRAAQSASTHGVSLLMSVDPPESAFGVVFLDGLAAGLLIAEARQKAAVQ